MLCNNLKPGSSINASKPTGVLNRLTSSGTIFAWYQDKPVGVLNRPAGSGSMLRNNLKPGSSINASKSTGVLNRLAGRETILARYQDKPVGVLNRLIRREEISDKKVWLMHYYAHDS